MRKSQIYYYTSMLFTAVAPGMYIMYALGVFEEGIASIQTATAMGFYLGISFMGYQVFRQLQKKAADVDNQSHKQRAIGTSAQHMTPWLLLLIFTGLVHFGVASLVQHVSVIVAMEAVGSVFLGFSKYHQLEENA